MYDKFGLVLRIETVINCPKDFAIQKFTAAVPGSTLRDGKTFAPSPPCSTATALPRLPKPRHPRRARRPLARLPKSRTRQTVQQRRQSAAVGHLLNRTQSPKNS